MAANFLLFNAYFYSMTVKFVIQDNAICIVALVSRDAQEAVNEFAAMFDALGDNLSSEIITSKSGLLDLVLISHEKNFKLICEKLPYSKQELNIFLQVPTAKDLYTIMHGCLNEKGQFVAVPLDQRLFLSVRGYKHRQV